MDGRGLRNRRRTAALLAASFFTIALLAPTGTHAQIYIPPPDDLIEPQPALPPAIDPGQPPPATPPPSAPATMTWDEAKTQARDLGSSVRGANQGITNAPGAAGQIPGYQANYPGLTQYYDNPGNMYADGAAAGYNSDAYRTANSTARPTVDVKRSDLSRATTVTEDPNAYLQGMSADGSTGNCVPLPPGSGGTNMAEWTCNVGSTVVEQPKTCTRSLSVAAWNETLYQYICVTSPADSLKS